MIPLRIEPSAEARAFRQTEAAGSSLVRGDGDLSPTEALRGPAGSLEAPASDAIGNTGFERVFAQAIADASSQRHAADAKVQALAAGAEDDLHGTMIAVKEAEISTRLIGTIRNKLLDAFQELWRTSV